MKIPDGDARRSVALMAASIALLSSLLPVTASATEKSHSLSSNLFGRTEQTPFLRAVRELDLTPDQKSQIRTITAQARSQHLRPSSPDDFQALTDPGNPGHAAAVQTAERRAAQVVLERSELDARVYTLLTSEQKSALPGILTAMHTGTPQ